MFPNGLSDTCSPDPLSPLPEKAICPVCDGSGDLTPPYDPYFPSATSAKLKVLPDPIPCPTCHGTGVVWGR